jgi:phytoene desaturase
MGGLTTGALLAQSGMKVLVLEQHYEVGGCASMFRRKNFHFDVAIHLVGGCQPGGEVYNLYHKLSLLDQIDFIEVDPMYHLRVGNFVYEVPSNLDQFEQKMVEWFPEDRVAILETMKEIKWIGKAFIDGTFQQDPKVLQRVMKLNTISFADYVAGRFQHPHTFIVLSSLHLYAGVNLKQLPTIFMINLMMSYHEGAFYPKGGSQKLTHVLRNYICSQNGEVLVKRKVEKILSDGTKVQGVIDQKGNKYHAPIVVSNADMKKTMTELLGSQYLPELYSQSLQKLIPAHSAVILYAVLRNKGVTLTIPHELFLFPEDEVTDDHKYLYRPLDPQSDPCITICRPSVVDRSLAPEGYSVISVTTFCDWHAIEKLRQEQEKQTIADRYIQLLESKLPGLQKQIVSYELATPSTLERFTSSSQGALYGWQKSMQQPWMAKMGPNTPIEGLYLTGQWTPHVHGVYGTCLSGRKTTEMILKEFRAKI